MPTPLDGYRVPNDACCSVGQRQPGIGIDRGVDRPQAVFPHAVLPSISVVSADELSDSGLHLIALKRALRDS